MGREREGGKRAELGRGSAGQRVDWAQEEAEMVAEAAVKSYTPSRVTEPNVGLLDPAPATRRPLGPVGLYIGEGNQNSLNPRRHLAASIAPQDIVAASLVLLYCWALLRLRIELF